MATQHTSFSARPAIHPRQVCLLKRAVSRVGDGVNAWRQTGVCSSVVGKIQHLISSVVNCIFECNEKTICHSRL